MNARMHAGFKPATGVNSDRILQRRIRTMSNRSLVLPFPAMILADSPITNPSCSMEPTNPMIDS
jgi:hypothetical protein